ncbi:MAG TPA: IclR family transcriptional regulator [Solirubrobacteraceae bacterium]|jgi:IclR family pca regulon transcriptional regulator
MPSLPQTALEREPSQVPAIRERHYSQSLDRGLAILGCFTAETPVLGVSEIARRLRMSHGTTHRYISSLAYLGYLEQRRDRKYMLTLKVTQLGMAALSSTAVAEHARPHMQTLVERSNFTVSLAMLDGTDVLYLERVSGRRASQRKTDLDLNPGSRLPAHCTALGKLLLSHLSDAELSELLPELKLERHTPRTITGKRALRTELRGIAKSGIALNAEELAPGLCAIAAPVRAELGEVVAALSLTAHSSAIAPEEMPAQLGPHLIVTADNISARLGYRRPDQLTRA